MDASTTMPTGEESGIPANKSAQDAASDPELEGLVQIGGASAVEVDWVKGPKIGELREAKPFRWDIGETSVILLLFEGNLQAFHNRCAHMGLPLEKGIFDFKLRALLCPYHAYRFDCTSGQCLNFPNLQLKVYPVQIKDGHVWVKPA